MRRVGGFVASLSAVVAFASPPSASPPDAAGLAARALAICRKADGLPREAQRKVLSEGLALAEHAVAADDADAHAHLAVFCNLGKRMRLDGAGLGSLWSLWRLRREVERAVTLAPGDPDALVGKGALLYYLPRFFGGDRAEAERLVRQALTIAPDYYEVRLAFARELAAHGASGEAREEARAALAYAERDANVAIVSAARAFLDGR